MAAEPRRLTQRGLYFDECELDVIYQHRPGRTMTEYDNTLFSALSMNPQAIHLDAAFCEDTEFGQWLMNSMFTLATLIGMSVGQITQGTIVAQLGLSDVTFPRPMFAGDTLYCETRITGKRESTSRPNQGIVTMEHIGRNQHGEIVATATRSVLMHKNPDVAA